MLALHSLLCTAHRPSPSLNTSHSSANDTISLFRTILDEEKLLCRGRESEHYLVGLESEAPYHILSTSTPLERSSPSRSPPRVLRRMMPMVCGVLRESSHVGCLPRAICTIYKECPAFKSTAAGRSTTAHHRLHPPPCLRHKSSTWSRGTDPPTCYVGSLFFRQAV